MILARVFVYGNAEAYAFYRAQNRPDFAHGAAEDPDTRAILESSIKLGKVLGLKIVVEGIEIQADYELVVELGCDEKQGYIIAQPLPADKFPRWLANYEKANNGHY